MSDELAEEIKAQRDLLSAESGDLAVQIDPLLTKEVLDELRTVYLQNPIAADRQIELGTVWSGISWCDHVLLLRVLGNMLKNGLEAAGKGETVTMNCLDQDQEVVVAVHNPGVIPAEAQLQVFQRSFSTKGQPGRGIGTYSMKLLGEQYLGGKVAFVSCPQEGTTFTLTLPKKRNG